MSFDLKRLIGKPEEDARLLCEHYNYQMIVGRDDEGAYFVTPPQWDAPPRVLVCLSGNLVSEVRWY